MQQVLKGLFNCTEMQLNKRKKELTSVSSFITIILKEETIENIAIYYNITRKTLRQRLKEYLSIYGELNCRGNRTIRLALLDYAHLAVCNNCNKVSPLDNFHKTNVNISGIRYICKECTSNNLNKTYHRLYSKIHYLNNKSMYLFYASNRRARKLEATTKFGQNGVLEFYKSRPVGYHIDHIIPLNHHLVCGLHNIYNLQYLTAEANLKKSNKFNVGEEYEC